MESFSPGPAHISRERSTYLKPVSFDNYYTLWKGIATSIHGYKEPNGCKCVNTQVCDQVHRQMYVSVMCSS